MNATDVSTPQNAAGNQAHLGLSGITREPAASMAPITHWMNKGILHERSDSMKEQK